MTSAAQKKAMAAHRRRVAAKGLVRVEVQVSAGDASLLREMARRLRGGKSDAEKARNALRVSLAASDDGSALNMFASDLPDEYFEGVFDHERKVEDREIDL